MLQYVTKIFRKCYKNKKWKKLKNSEKQEKNYCNENVKCYKKACISVTFVI